MSATPDLTPRERHCIVAVSQFIADHGYSPTLREIATMLGYTSVSTSQVLVLQLTRKGLLQSKPDQARTIRLAENLVVRDQDVFMLFEPTP